MSAKNVSEMSTTEIQQLAGARTAVDVSTRYADATTCECGALIEEIDQGGDTYWAHVKRMRIHYDHAAVPSKPEEQ